MAHVRVLGIDMAKRIFHVVGMDDTCAPEKFYSCGSGHDIT
jgi:hypothetical protein